MATGRFLVIGDAVYESGVVVESVQLADEPAHLSRHVGKPHQRKGRAVAIRGGAWRIVDYLRARTKGDADVLTVPDDIHHIQEAPPRVFVKLRQFPKSMGWVKRAKLWLPESEQRPFRIESSIAVQRAEDSYYHSMQRWMADAEVTDFLCKKPVLVICDRQLGFREAIGRSGLKDVVLSILKTLQEKHSDPWLVLETTDPLDRDQLDVLKLLQQAQLANRTIVVMSANSLKSSGIVLHDDLSLERAIEDFMEALLDILKALQQAPTDGLVRTLLDVRYFVIRLGSQAALLWRPAGTLSATKDENATVSEVDRKQLAKSVRLVYGDKPYEPQASPAAESSDLGTMHGFSSVLTAELATRLATFSSANRDSDAELDDIILHACRAGLHLCKRYFTFGLGESPAEFEKVFERLFEHAVPDDAALKDAFPFVSGTAAVERKREWSIVSERTDELKETDIAIDVVRNGIDVLTKYGIPYAKHVHLTTADRHEIENYAGIASLITKYMDDAEWKKPLCIGVFGPPGCGKSFGIEQVVQAITGYKPSIHVSRMKVNLSQFKSSEQLALAFHDVRNEGLAGMLPLVFVDEFDTSFEGRDYGWLKYLLAPMQDGEFLDDDEWYHLPRCILVFIGGQNRDFIEFESRLRDPQFIAAKGRDFISRLRHYLVVKGPDLPGPGDDPGENEVKHGRRLRRAMLLRSVLERNLPSVIETVLDTNGKEVKRVNVDEYVLEAFLEINSYKHGVRSLEAIVDMSRASVTRRSFQKSSLPAEEQLELHVDARQFLAIVNGGIRNGEAENARRSTND